LIKGSGMLGCLIESAGHSKGVQSKAAQALRHSKTRAPRCTRVLIPQGFGVRPSPAALSSGLG